MKNRVSVVITTYNLERYLEEALESVLRQTRMPDEIIVADDHSTDSSEQIFARYGDRIRLVRQAQNAGALRNTLSGLLAATGDVVAFLDGDDVWMPTKLEKTVGLFDACDQMVIASHDHQRMDADGRDMAVEDDTNANVSKITRNHEMDLWGDLFRDSILFRRGYWFGSAYVVRKAAIDFTAFNAILEQNADLARWSYLDMVMGPYITASNPLGRVGFVNERLFRYRVHAGGTSGSTADKQRMINSLRRSQSVNRLTQIALKDCPDGGRIEKRFAEMDAVHQLSKYQYEGRRTAAIAQFLRITPQLVADRLFAKELARLAATTLLGVDRFLRVKNRHS